VTFKSKSNFGILSRGELCSRLKNNFFDVLVIGGGATGAGVALEAATRGLKTALIEANDFSSGTSSRSTKMVHGGVRYLESAIKRLNWREYGLVHDALKERKRFLQNAPHLTDSLPILTPVYGWFDAFYYLIGLKFYDLLAGKASLGPSKFLSKKSSLECFPALKKKGLKGAVLYYDGQFDDARMNVTLILSALKAGATALNYVRAKNLLKDNKKIIGAQVCDAISGETWHILAKVVINATGAFTDRVRKMDDPNTLSIMSASQGSHILLPKIFSSLNTGLIIPKTEDDRVLFILPWMGKTIAGTTDRPENITECPRASNEEVEYILKYVRQYLDIPIKRSDVLATWSGLRPLAKKFGYSMRTADISRDHIIDVSQSNLITIVGGKWTTYRKMGEDVIDTAVKIGNLNPLHDSCTKNLKLVGGDCFQESLAQELTNLYKLDLDIAKYLAKSYGDQVYKVIDIKHRFHIKRLLEGFPFIEAEVIYAVNYEYALKVTDVVARRLRLAFLHNEAAKLALSKIVSLMAGELAWNHLRIKEEIKQGEMFLASMITKSDG
jgi:glycerol-3-phosphate dehydrogenase